MCVGWLFDIFEGYWSLGVQKQNGHEFLSKESKNHDNQVRVHTWKNENWKRCKRVSSCCFLIVWAPTACKEAMWVVCASWIHLNHPAQVDLHSSKMATGFRSKSCYRWLFLFWLTHMMFMEGVRMLTTRINPTKLQIRILWQFCKFWKYENENWF